MKYDEIHIENLEFYARHGVFPEETKLGQKFIISLVMYTNTQGAGKRDDLELSVDYGAVSHFITEYMQKNTFKLIEAAAENLARELLLRYPLLEGVDLEDLFGIDPAPFLRLLTESLQQVPVPGHNCESQ